MHVRVLGCSGAIAKDCRTTSFLIGGDLLIDAGTGVGDLTLDEMCRIDHVLLTHSHLDHVAALPLMLDAIGSHRSSPLQVHARPETIAALKAHIFNNVIWPDFSVIPSVQAPFVRFHPVSQGQVLCLGGRTIEVLPAVHTVPAVGYAVNTPRGYWVFTGDTECNPLLWARINQLPVAMLVIEATFSNREQALAQRSQHLSPAALVAELDHIAPGQHFPIYITHTKPAETEHIMAELHSLRSTSPRHPPHDIRWLHAGQELDLSLSSAGG